MGKRHRARESAVQCLYQWEVTGANPDALLAGYWENHGPPELQVKQFAETLFHGVLAHAEEIDAMISAQTEHWRMERLGLVEKSILRLGVYELLFESDTPPAVVIDEAVDICKRFCGPDAAPFVNGVLDGIRERAEAGMADEQ
jgi:N utilization substance protein B